MKRLATLLMILLAVTGLGAISSQVITIDDTAYDATSWNGNGDAHTKNAIRDQVEAMVSPTYIVQTADSTLSGEQALGALSTGIVKNTTSTGVLSIAAAGTDYLAPSGSAAALVGDDEAISAANSDGDTGLPTKNAVYDKVAAMTTGIPFTSGLVESTLADAETVYFGGVSAFAPAAAAAQRRIYLPAGTITGVTIVGFPSNAGVSNENCTAFVRLNDTSNTNITTAFAFSSSAFGQTVVATTGLSISVAQGDYIDIGFTAPTMSTNPTNVYWHGTIFMKPGL